MRPWSKAASIRFLVGAYPVAFTACRDAGADWVTYRRAPLLEATAAPRRSWTVRDGRRISVSLADEAVRIKGYGDARQLTLFEHGAPVLQVLTSDTTAAGAALLCWLRARWRIENMFKYAAEHNGIDTLADYGMDIGPNTRKVANIDNYLWRGQLYLYHPPVRPTHVAAQIKTRYSYACWTPTSHTDPGSGSPVWWRGHRCSRNGGDHPDGLPGKRRRLSEPARRPR